LHETKLFVTLHRDADAELIASIKDSFTSDLARQIGVTPVERAANIARNLYLSRQLQEATDYMEEFDLLVGKNVSGANTFLPTDLSRMRKMRTAIDRQIERATLYEEILSFSKISKLPRMAVDTVWYRIADPRYAAYPLQFIPAHIPSRFNPGAFPFLAFAQDIPTATFELNAHVDLAETLSTMKQWNLTQYGVKLDEVADFSDPDAVNQDLGLDFSALLEFGSRSRVSVVQRICTILIEAGFQGAIFPSRISIGKNDMVLFESSLKARQPLSVLFSGRIKSK
jgi:RES domain-containing protein